LQSALYNGMMKDTTVMATFEPSDSKTNELVVSPRDILFECPSCGKNLVVDEAAQGLIIDCPQCHISVIVPPKPTLASAGTQPKPAPADTGSLRDRLVTIAGKLKELQTQRTEINNRLAARINDINRDLVMTARLETSHQQVLAELNQLVAQIGTPGAPSRGSTRVNLRS